MFGRVRGTVIGSYLLSQKSASCGFTPRSKSDFKTSVSYCEQLYDPQTVVTQERKEVNNIINSSIFKNNFESYKLKDRMTHEEIMSIVTKHVDHLNKSVREFDVKRLVDKDKYGHDMAQTYYIPYNRSPYDVVKEHQESLMAEAVALNNIIKKYNLSIDISDIIKDIEEFILLSKL